MKEFISCIFIILGCSCHLPSRYDIILKNGMVYDGSGGDPYRADLGINADTIAAIGDLSKFSAGQIIDARGMAVSPGFINMLSWANESLIQDGRSQSDIRQGVTLEVMGEGSSMGPLNSYMKNQMERGETDIKYKVEWTTLGEYLSYLENKGISCNVASFIGAGTIRQFVIGEDNRPATPAELDSMRMLVRQAMQEGAMGVGSSLIYPPDFFADTKELIALCREAAKYNGMYISHLRSEGTKLLEALQELITIAKETGIRAEVYHLKAAGTENWYKLDSAIAMIDNARSAGIDITADIYTYTAGATGLTACFPPSLQDGGFGNLWHRLQDPLTRSRMKSLMHINADDWENFYYDAGNPSNIMLLAFKQDSLKKYSGKTLTEVTEIRGKSPEETAMDLIVQDSTRVGVAFFLMSENNIRKKIVIPWVSFGSDEGSFAPEGIFLKFNPHPRAYGNFARLLGKYTRDEHLISLQQAIFKLSKLPAENLKLKKRGVLKVGYYADVLVFDPAAIADHATYENPYRYATGMSDVFVNGVQVLENGEHTGATPGRFIRGPGYTPE